MKKKRWKDMSPPERGFALVLIAISLVLVGTAERDLQQRPADQVRGEKWVWRLLCLNALAAVSYLRWGRRKAA